jgi:hypothetical protein
MEYMVENTVCNRAREAGWITRKLQWVGRKGAPDRFFLKAGRIVLIEFKDRGKQPSVIQLREIERFKEAGAEVYVIDTVRDGLGVLGI